ncbi:hypothetical protein SAMN05421810_105390 [Amycolatopsis arida]|uniref:Proteins of 100 residues with WXG n=1 Tax=Amycolatopsis arida TaxID=587909 RepID=A0A1I5X1W3_9PSEU|nr:hypothetical protein [Amycolatopsis arida]TDX92564.1 hypothetical protein CLV69_105409 [Amycolatopsis arida]SFQ25959.1 hypothetical protein SAMN05421810_105390 [Amycolatopsis arida]
MSKSWNEVKQLLDDPYVSADTKEELLLAYSYENGGNRIGGVVEPPEARQYMERYNFKGDAPYSRPDALGNPGVPYYGSTDKVYERARSESDEAGHHAREQRTQITENQGELDGLRPPGPGGAGVKTSDELFELAEPALDVFRDFLPVDEQVPEDSRGVEGPLQFDRDIQQRFDEQKGIDFAKFLDEAEKLRDAHTVLSELKRTSDGQLNSLYEDWTGAGANASYDKYGKDIQPHADELIEHLAGAPQVIEAAVQTVYDACKAKADEVLALYTDTLGSATKDIAGKVMKLARGEFDSQEQVLEVAAWVDSVCGSNLESTIRSDDCGLNDENKAYVISECKKWIRQSWNPDLYGSSGAQGLYLRFEQVCDDTVEAVDAAWEELANYLKEYENKFPEVRDPGPANPNPNPGDTPGGGTPGGGTPGGGTPGGGMPGGGGTPPSASTPETPGTEKPEAGTNPVTGEPLEVNPETGEPYPIDPETGEAVKDLGEDRDTLTVEQGDHKIEISEPDESGDMAISVDDGSGAVKDYQLDFGTGEDKAGDEAGDVAGGDTAGQGEFGPRGGGPGGEQVYRPGPDGKIHIEDGDLRITAEQPEGPEGPTVVTVDDGTGEPTTYTLGEESAAGARPGEPRPGEGPRVGGEARIGRAEVGPDGLGVERGDGGIETKPAAGDRPPAAVGVAAGGGGAPGDMGGLAEAGAAGAGVGAEADTGSEPADDAAERTTPAAVGGGSGGGLLGDAGFGGGGASDGAPLEEGSQSAAAAPGAAQPAGVGAGLGSAPGGLGDAGAGAGAAGMGGMGMMGGGMGAMGVGGGGGGDQERGSNPYRIDGGIFDTGSSANRISGSLNDEGERSVRFDR